MNSLSTPISALWPRSMLAVAVVSALLAGCASTTPSMGGNKGVVSGSASGESAEGNNSKLENCTETLGTVAIEEDTAAPWYLQLHDHKLGSTIPVLRLMIQQSNCFVIVERGKSLHSMQRERDLARSDESRAGSNFGKGQMVAADYTMSPSIQFSGKTGGGNAFGGGFGGSVLGMVAGSVSRNEASTTLLLIDNRSGVQIGVSEGSASKTDFGGFLGVGDHLVAVPYELLRFTADNKIMLNGATKDELKAMPEFKYASK